MPLACIVGAPRCGTTTLSRWLRQHRDVCFSKIKEPHFFTLTDLANLSDAEADQIIERDYIKRYFGDRARGAALMAEGSVSYLYAPERLLPLLRVWPDAKFVIAVRDPIELLKSYHQRLLFQGDETVADFAEAWRLQKARGMGQKVPRSCIEARQLQYLEVARLGKHVRHFMEVVGRERCHVTLFDDLRDDPQAVYRKLLRFLDLPDDGFSDFRAHRPSRGFRIGWLQRLLKRPTVVTKNSLVGSAFRHRLAGDRAKLPSSLEQVIARLRRAALNWNERPPPKTDMPAALRREIRDCLDSDVRDLSRLIGRNLSTWLR